MNTVFANLLCCDIVDANKGIEGAEQSLKLQFNPGRLVGSLLYATVGIGVGAFVL